MTEVADAPAPATSRSRRPMPRAARVAQRLAVPAAVVCVAAALRLPNLQAPHAFVFDETYYVKDAYSIWQLGYEGRWPDGADDAFMRGTVLLTEDPSFVVHPPLGKWILGIGTAIGGIDDPTAWRWPAAVIGVLLVVATILVARGLTSSTMFGSLAGLLLAIDGQAIVMSRTVLLDQTLALFVLLAAGAMLLDRRGSPERTVRWRALHPPGSGVAAAFGPAFWNRPWLLTAGVLLGLACAVKWSGIYYLAAFGLWTVALDMLDRRRAKQQGWFGGTLVTQAPVSFILLVPTALVVYVASFAGWLRGGYDSSWASDNPDERLTGALAWVPESLQSLWHYHQSIATFHVGLTDDHPFQSPAAQWLALVRPTAFHLEEGGGMMSFITALPNPVVWYAAVLAFAFLLWHTGRALDRRAAFLVVAVIAGYVPWLLFPERTIFAFYSIVFEPFLVIGLAVALHYWIRRPGAGVARKRSGRIVVITLIVLACAAAVFFAPIWYGIWLPANEIQWRFWLPGWR